MRQTIDSLNNSNSLFTDLEALLTEHFRCANAICDLLEQHSAKLGLTAAGHQQHDSTKPHLELIRGGG